MTKAQYSALKWLREHNGDGMFDRYGVLVAAGERAPHMHQTWKALRDAGVIEYYDNKRVRLI